MTAEDVYTAPDEREALLELARPCVGLSFREETREAYAALVAPGEPAATAYEMARTMSSCGLFARALWGRYGLEDASLEAPYRVGMVIADLIAMAHEAGAWRVPGRIDELAPADVVIIGHPEHVLVVESVEAGVVTSIDGGQRDDGRNYAIARRVRRLGAGRSLVSSDGGTRSILGWISWPEVVAKFSR